MMLFLPYLLFAEPIDFHVDPVIYRSTVDIMDTVAQTAKHEDIFYIEFNCEIPYHELSYETVDSLIVAKAIMPFKIVDYDHSDSLADTLYRRFAIPSFSQAARQQISFIVQFGLHVPETRLRYRIEVLSGQKRGSIEKEIIIEKENYKMSDILLASDIASDTVGDFLRKGNLRVVPQSSHRYDERYPTLYIYYEIYDIVPDSNKLSVTYKIEDESGKTVRKVSQQIEKDFESQAVNLGFDMRGFDPGEYTFRIELNDPGMQMTASKEVTFEIARRVLAEISYEGLPYYDEVDYFLKSSDYKYFKSLPEEGKRLFLKRFWSTRNYYEIAERFEYADKHYGQGYTSGSKTDRGRIYVKYGACDDIERSTIETRESRSYERWQYPNGDQFVFVDIRGTNEYVLVWTDVRGERSQPTLYKYLPGSIKEQIR